MIQTYSPEHYSIQTAAKQDYHAFYKEEISYRSLMRYPPEWQMLVVFASGEDKAWLDKVMDAMANVVKHMDLMVIGPSEAGFGKINDQYRKVIYIKNKDYETSQEKESQEQTREGEHEGEPSPYTQVPCPNCGQVCTAVNEGTYSHLYCPDCGDFIDYGQGFEPIN